MKLKETLDAGSINVPHVSQGDLWWASIGENIGYEINGKSSLFSRPVIIFKKLAHGLYFVIPTTTKIRNGSWYVSFQLQDKNETACLHQARALDHKRLSSKIGRLDDTDYKKISLGFQALYVPP